MPDPKSYLFDLPRALRPDRATLQEEWYPGVRDYWADASSSRIYDPILGIRAIVIHATAGVSSNGAMSVMAAGRASWHWLVPDEDESAHGAHVWACAPEARAAWHVRNSCSHAAVNGGADKVNHWSLGIEIVNSQTTGVIDPFSDWQVATTAAIVRYCWAKYPNLKQVVSHALLDPERRSDPGAHFPWEEFSGLVLNGVSTERAPDSFVDTIPMAELPSPPTGLSLCCAKG
ncbi:N-acetylmuramoyl-L-alanine amidase [Roseibium sp.]|uniref:N-acetylmuramoyl-L-alanine amidase n=1 Tax=Roseibium sp. TaxID=1936156 RepID=UPI003A9742B9